MATVRMYRQGDVALREAKDVDLSTAKPVKANRKLVILAYGEVTGHHHSMASDTVTMLRMLDGREVIVVDEITPLVHQEHAAIEVLPGTYFVVHQREYTPTELRRVLD